MESKDYELARNELLKSVIETQEKHDIDDEWMLKMLLWLAQQYTVKQKE